MGVPKFFRYTSERYPCLNELVKQHQIPEFDNMYLDMNGIIHNCSHPDDSDAHFRISEEKIYKDVFHYIDILFQIIKPKKLFFMAIDGVAPRAKMNQQRGRRFRSAREAEKLEEEAKKKGEVLPTEKRFDSNCITPGTVFMARLQEQLKYFIKQKISEDSLWANVKVVLSGHETPGEGEHKIMDYIRWARCQSDYDPNTRHCLYGLDADLIMLGMCTHEPHFALLREEVKFGKTTKRAATPEETNFYLLHLTLLREYLEQEFLALKENLPFKFDIEKVIDDWVLMGFLVGNDFIPNLPNMHISNDMLPHLYQTYIKVLPTLEGYINEAGILNLERFEIFMQELAKIDMEKFQDTYADLKYFEAKTGRRPNANERKEYKPDNDETFNVNVEDIKAEKPDAELQALIDATQEMYMEDVDEDGEEYDDTSDEEANMRTEFNLHKRDYYMNKLDYSNVTEEVLADQATCYVRAIQWNLHYYYRGCPSWCWYYPHHYAPYISDIKGFKDFKIEFELGEPFKPFEQLLAVLPAASKHLLPTPFHDLMTDEDSPIVHYYPVNFETDLNGKRNDWEAVVLIPFIDEVNLLSAMAPCYQRLTEEELKRNSHGPMLIYHWTAQNLGPCKAPDYFPTISECHAAETQMWRSELDVPTSRLVYGMLPTADPELLYPGFPTMRHLRYKSSMKKNKVKVFDQPSRNESLIVEIIQEKDTDQPLEEIANEYLGKVLWVSWPHLTKAKVVSVSNEQMRLHNADKPDANGLMYSTERNVGNMHKQWLSERATIIEHNMGRLGIDLGEVKTIIHAVVLTGYKYVIVDDELRCVEQWSPLSCGYAAQAVVRTVRAAPRPPPLYLSPQDAYPSGDTVFLLTHSNYYACSAKVVSAESIRSGRIKVRVLEQTEPVPRAPAADSSAAYRTANHAAAACGIAAQLMSRITGTVLVVLGQRNDLPTETQNKLNVGLNLKFNKKNQEVCGFTRRCAVTGAWLYSARCVRLVETYARNFPEVFDRLSCLQGKDVFFESDLWPDAVGERKPYQIVDWMKTEEHHNAARRECGSEVLEPEEMKVVNDDLQMQLQELQKLDKMVTLHIKWNLLYKAQLQEGSCPPDPSADYRLLDRVVAVRGSCVGARGTIVGVLRGSAPSAARLTDKLHAPPTYLVMLDEERTDALREPPLFDEPRFLRVQAACLMNISYGRKLRRVTSAELQPFTQLSNANPLRSHADTRSAFAAYSPPRDISSKTSNRSLSNNSSADPAADSPAQDGTHLLRSLLKISDGDAPPNNKKPATQPKNWRSKNEPQPVSSPNNSMHPFWNVLVGFPPQQNWRKENQYGKNPPPQPLATNIPYQNQHPIPPYPTFSQPFNMPGPSQIPFPQFQTFQTRNPYGYSATESRNTQARGQQNNRNQQGFPQHLPNVANHTALMPGWTNNQNSNSSASNAPAPAEASSRQPEKAAPVAHQTLPFVPLQVQTGPSRRLPSNKTISTKRETQTAPPPKPVEPADLPTPQFVALQAQNKPKKKRRIRVAANLPFQLD